MRLKSITVKNFKSIGEEGLTIDFAPITLLFGPNNAGKSSIIKALYLAYMFFCQDDPDFDYIGFMGIGSFEDYIFKHEIDRNLYIKIAYSTGTSSLKEIKDCDFFVKEERISKIFHEDRYRAASPCEIRMLFHEISVGFVLHYNKMLCRVCVSSISIYANNEVLAIFEIGIDGENNNKFINNTVRWSDIFKKCILHAFNFMQMQYSYSDREEEFHTRYVGEDKYKLEFFTKRGVPMWDLIGPNYVGMTHYTPDEIIGEAFMDFVGPCKKLLKQPTYVGGLRTPPDKFDVKNVPANISGWYSGQSAWKALYEASSSSLDNVNKLLAGNTGLNIGYAIDLKRYYKLDQGSGLYRLLRDAYDGGNPALSRESVEELFNQIPERELWLLNLKNGTRIHPADAGTGISQIVPVVAASTLTSPHALVAIEQPELHIHPAWQVALGDMFIDAVKEDPDRIFLIETHSEHLLLRLRRRVHEYYEYEQSLAGQEPGEDAPEPPEHALKSTDLAIYWIGNKDGTTTAERVEMDEEGYFETRWPEGFFEERDAELFG